MKVNELEALLILRGLAKDCMEESLKKWVQYAKAGQNEKEQEQWREIRYFEEITDYVESKLRQEYSDDEIRAVKGNPLWRQ